MDDSPTERLDPVERGVHVGDREVGQRCGVAWAGAPLVDPDGEIPGVRLPAPTFGRVALGQLEAEQVRPKPPRAIWIVGRKLEQGLGAVHAEDDNAERRPRCAERSRLESTGTSVRTSALETGGERGG
jgi:hypothetical protein